ncbi:MAG: O-antigen ligase family protein [Roseibium album]|uniref:O-antigen ligase family protein n=1 Tax=Roseibium album TaxID=311410 RepID=UPI0032EF487A
MMRRNSEQSVNWIPVLLLLSLLVPVFFFLGPVRLTVYRVILLLVFIPVLMSIFSGKKKIYLFDYLILFSFSWSVLSLSVVHGFGDIIETSAIYFIEGVGAYLTSRMLISNRESFVVFVKVLFFAIVGLLPFAVYESLTGQPIIIDFLRKFFAVPPSLFQDKRLGLERSQVVFEHSILFGVFCSSVFGMTFYVLNRRSGFFTAYVRLGLVFVASFLSISGGAVVAIFIQGFWITWDKVTAFARIPYRWWLLTFGFLAAYIFIDILSNRSPFHVFVSYLTFSPGSAYNRILIWEYGTETVYSAPVFGIGMGRWLGPEWMGDSVDNFWLLVTMRYGVPGGLTFMAAIYFLMKNLGSRDFNDEELGDFRKGYLVSLGGMIVAGCTVHYWNATYILFMLMLGSGVWMADAGQKEKAPEEGIPDEKKDPRKRYMARPKRQGKEVLAVDNADRARNPYVRKRNVDARTKV